MNKYFLMLTFFSSVLSTIKAQEGLPRFDIKQIVLHVPAFLPGIMKDDSVDSRNDTLTYRLKGQLFEKGGLKVSYSKRFMSLATPWETIFELADAYSKKNKERIINLYTDDSQDKVKRLLSGGQAPKFLEGVGKAVNSNFRILGGIDYKEGFMVFSKDDSFGVHQNYILKEDGKYKLSALNDDASTAWNIALYFKFAPKPMIPLSNIVIPDSLQLRDSVNVNITVPDSYRWVAMYYGKPGESVRLLIQDNGINDANPLKNKLSFNLQGRSFITRGDYVFYIATFNHPVQRISKSFFLEKGKYNIRIF